MSLPSTVYSLPEQGIQLPLPNCICGVVQYISVFFSFLNLLLIYIGFSFNGMSNRTFVKNHREKNRMKNIDQI